MKERDFRTLDDFEPVAITAAMLRNTGPASSRILSVLRIAPDIVLTTSGGPPNAWRRFWAWFLLGWKWERL